MPDRPSGSVTFVFTDIEGSTRLWEADRAGMTRALRVHDELLRLEMERRGGYVFSAGGDAFSVAFQQTADAVSGSLAVQLALQSHEWGDFERLRIRIAIHAGVADERDGNYFGPPLNRCARLLSIAGGGRERMGRRRP